MNIHTDSESGEEGPEYSEIVDRGEKLWDRLIRLEYKYMGLVWLDGLYSLASLPGPSKKAILDDIDDNLETIDSRCYLFSFPDLTSPDAVIPEGIDKEVLPAIVHLQQKLKKEKTALPYAWIRRSALRSYRRLAEDYRTFRAVVTKRPANMFGIKIISPGSEVRYWHPDDDE